MIIIRIATAPNLLGDDTVFDLKKMNRQVHIPFRILEYLLIFLCSLNCFLFFFLYFLVKYLNAHTGMVFLRFPKSCYKLLWSALPFITSIEARGQNIPCFLNCVHVGGK